MNHGQYQSSIPNKPPSSEGISLVTMSQPWIPVLYEKSGSSENSNKRKANSDASRRFRERKKEMEMLQQEVKRLESQLARTQEELEREIKNSEFLRNERDYYRDERDYYRSQAPHPAQFDRPRSPKHSINRVLT
ncbi:hypothetical protein BJX65DRAFT_27045 [Aspergillus insuetus]